MATVPVPQGGTLSGDASDQPGLIAGVYRYGLLPLASLKLAVVLFALAIVVIMVGTLAQVERDIWQVLEDYFKPWVIWIDVPLLCPRSWFPQRDAGHVSRVFALGVLGCSLICAAMTLANAIASAGGSRVRSRWSRPAVGIAATVLVSGVLVGLSSWLRGGFWFPGGR